MVKKRLRDIVLTRWDVVDRGDNPEARVVMFKSKGGMLGEEVDENGNTKKGEENTMTLKEILAKLASEQPLSKEEQEFLKTETEAKDNEIDTLKEQVDSQKTATEDMKKKLGEVETKLEEATKKQKPEEKPEEKIAKADPAIQEEFKKMKERLDKAEEKEKESNERVEKLEDSIAKEKLVAKVKELPGVIEDPDKMADAMLKIRKSAPKEFALIEEALEKANKVVVESTLLKSVGSNEEGDAGDAENKIKKGAEAIRKSQPELTPEQAEQKFLEENPKVYEEYEAAKGV